MVYISQSLAKKLRPAMGYEWQNCIDVNIPALIKVFIQKLVKKKLRQKNTDLR